MAPNMGSDAETERPDDAAGHGLPDQDNLLFAQFAIDRLSDAVYWVKQDASIIYVNEATCQLQGYSREELLGMRIYDLNPDTSAEQWPQIWARLQREGQRTFEARHRTKDGRFVPLEIMANYFVFKGQEYSCAFTRDITERKQLEQRLLHSEKMRAIGQLAGGVAHDFNNQLAGISGCADLLAQSRELNDWSRGLIEQIHRAVKRSSDLTSQLLAFSRQGKYLSEAINVHEIAGEVLDVLAHSIDRRIRLVREFGASFAVVDGDASQLQNALLNLALNARDAMAGGGQLTFSSANEELSQAECDRQDFQIAPGRFVVLSISDDGQGMAPETMERMFEPFFTTKEKGAGTGLGLAAVYGTIKNHKGAIKARSELGRGTTFRVYLPLSVTVPAHAGKARTAPVVLGNSLHVMVVEDEPQLRDIVKLTLQSLSCRVTAFADGQSALDFYRQAGSEIDVVLLDMCMPGLSGGEVFLALQKLNPRIKVLLASGYSLAGDAQSLLDQGALGFLHKPYRRADLAEKLLAISDQDLP